MNCPSNWLSCAKSQAFQSRWWRVPRTFPKSITLRCCRSCIMLSRCSWPTNTSSPCLRRSSGKSNKKARAWRGIRSSWWSRTTFSGNNCRERGNTYWKASKSESTSTSCSWTMTPWTRRTNSSTRKTTTYCRSSRTSPRQSTPLRRARTTNSR